MKKIACVIPPFYRLIESKNNRINLGMRYLAEILNQRGHSVCYINGDYEKKEQPYADRLSMAYNSWLFEERYQNGHTSFEETLHTLKEFKPDAVIIGAGDVLMPTVEVGSVKSCAYIAREVKREMGIHIHCIGYGHLLKYASKDELIDLDTIITGEGEDDIVSVIENERKGILPEKWIQSLDDLPMLTDTYSASHQDSEDWDYIMSRRGCGYQCTFCQQPAMRGSFVSYMSPQKLGEELEYRIINYGTKDFYFCDPIFLIPKEQRSQELLRVLYEIKTKYPFFTWRAEERITEAMSMDFLKHMKMAGCRHLKFGVEMFDTKMLSRFQKNIHLESARLIFKMCKEAGIETTAYVLLGCPGFKDHDYREMWGEFQALEADNYVINITIPYVGTQLYKNLEKELKTAGLYCNGEQGFYHLSNEMKEYWGISNETLELYFSLQGQKDDANIRSFKRKVVDRALFIETGVIKYIE